MASFYISNGNTNQMWSQWIDGGSSGSFDVGNHAIVGEKAGALRFPGVTVAQGTTIQSAYIEYYVGWKGTGSGNCKFKVYGIDEDNTGELTSYPLGRPATDAVTNADISLPSTGERFSVNVTSQVQEILNRGGWSSGNAMGFICWNNGSNESVYFGESVTDPNAYLVITVSSPSASVSPSPSRSQSPSSSQSASPSQTASASPSVSLSPSPSAYEHFTGVMRVSKPGYNVLVDDDPRHMIFDSQYGTLKYFKTGNLTVTLDGSDLVQVGSASYAHNLGYYPYFEVYVLNPLGEWEYCPTINGGASTTWSIYVVVTTTELKVYVSAEGFEVENEYTFKYFIFKNNLHL